MAWNGSGGYIGGLRYGAGTMGAHGWHGTRESNYRTHNPAGQRQGLATTTSPSRPATPTTPAAPSDAQVANHVDAYLNQANQQIDLEKNTGAGGRGITKKELKAVLEKAGVDENTQVSGPLAQVLLRHKGDFSTSKTAALAEKIANGDKDALRDLL